MEGKNPEIFYPVAMQSDVAVLLDEMMSPNARFFSASASVKAEAFGPFRQLIESLAIL